MQRAHSSPARARSPLSMMRTGKTAMVKLLLKMSSADVNARGRDGWTALHLALRRPCSNSGAQRRLEQLLAVLLDAGADVQAACSRSDGAEERGASAADASIEWGALPIALALSNRNVAAARLLVQRGAGVPPLEWARAAGCAEAVEELSQ